VLTAVLRDGNDNGNGNGNGNATAMATQSRRPLHAMAMAILGNENAIFGHCLWPLLVVEEPYTMVNAMTPRGAQLRSRRDGHIPAIHMCVSFAFQCLVELTGLQTWSGFDLHQPCWLHLAGTPTRLEGLAAQSLSGSALFDSRSSCTLQPFRQRATLRTDCECYVVGVTSPASRVFFSEHGALAWCNCISLVAATLSKFDANVGGCSHFSKPNTAISSVCCVELGTRLSAIQNLGAAELV
jgi:hypothetical protein